MRAYALMRRAAELEEAYRSSPFYERARAHLDALRAALGAVPFSSYRGIGRYPFTEYPESEPGWQWADIKPDESEPEARAVLARFLGVDDHQTPYPRSFLAQASHAKEVHATLTRPEKYEIVELCASPDHPQNLLGFDIGYWGGGNFSILCDAVIWPLWHFPTPDAFSELAQFAGKLNTHVLFPASEAATCYLDWYRHQSWAETEPSDFTLIAVGAWNG